MQGENKAIANLDMWNFQKNYQEEIEVLLNQLTTSRTQFGDYINQKLSAMVANSENWVVSIHATAKNPYFQLYKQSWKDAQVHYELLKYGAFPPTELQIVLHTREKGTTGKTPKLQGMQDEVKSYLQRKYGNDSFPVSYESNEAFEASMTHIFCILEDLIKTFTADVDNGVLPL